MVAFACWFAAVTVAPLLAWLTIRYGLLMPPVRGLPILMYHHVHPSRQDALTVTSEQFEQQLQFLKAAGYQPITCQDVIEHLDRGTRFPARPVLLTFDDGYVDNLEYAYPLLLRYGFKATVFLPVGLLGQTNQWDDGREPLLSVGQLSGLDPAVVELGLHSYLHENYQQMTPAEIANDARRCLAELSDQNLPRASALAYPYGRYPRERAANAAMQAELAKAGVGCAMRIGNRVNRLPLRSRYELRRINVKGTDSAWEFRTKVRKGRVKLF